MSSKSPPVRVGIYGPDNPSPRERHGCGLWLAGYSATLAAADAEPVRLNPVGDHSWEEVFEEVQGVVLVGHDDDRRAVALGTVEDRGPAAGGGRAPARPDPGGGRDRGYSYFARVPR